MPGVRDGNTRIYEFVIREPPPREPGLSPDQRVDLLPGLVEPEPAARTRATPGRLAPERRALPRPRQSSMGDEWPLIAAGLLLGLGIGGSIDSSAFHQVVQFHAGGTTAALVGVKTDPLWDGMLHAFTWSGTLVGLALLWRVARRARESLRTATFVGSLMLGWGIFNGIEGAADYRLLRLHHAQPGSAQLLWDGGLIVSSVILTLVGIVCIVFRRRAR